MINHLSLFPIFYFFIIIHIFLISLDIFIWFIIAIWDPHLLFPSSRFYNLFLMRLIFLSCYGWFFPWFFTCLIISDWTLEWFYILWFCCISFKEQQTAALGLSYTGSFLTLSDLLLLSFVRVGSEQNLCICLGSLFLGYSNHLCAVTWDLPHLFPFSQRSESCNAYCLITKNTLFLPFA